MAKKKRNYRKEYDDFHGKPEEIARRDARNKARREVAKKVGKAALKGKDVDHKDRNAQNNSASNLRIQSVKANRSRNSKKKK